jgi:type 1 glutamine amidotransferase
MMELKPALLLLGGAWHDFGGFASALGPVLEAHGWSLEASHDLDRLLRLSQATPRLLITYTGFTLKAEDGRPSRPDRMSDAQLVALTHWVRNGGSLLAAHASTVLGASDEALGHLLGGVFVEHPPLGPFTVYPVYGSHPITDGLSAFEVRDELYMEKCGPDIVVHMVAVKDGVAHPLVWSRAEGRGRVAHVALGHSNEVWGLDAYQRLMLQTVGWLDGG